MKRSTAPAIRTGWRATCRAKFGTPSYAREELIAEMGSAILCRRLQIGSELKDHADYLGGWCQILREDPRAVLKALGAAKKAADLITPEAIEEA
jgi:antirestriction protein ArdC